MINYQNINILSRSISLTAIGMFMAFCTPAAKSADGITYETVQLGDDLISIKCECLNLDYNETGQLDSRDFIVKDGFIYSQDSTKANRFIRRSCEGTVDDFEYIEPNWGDLEHIIGSVYLLGKDTSGNPYATSYTASSSAKYPFVIFPFDIIDGIPTFYARYECPEAGKFTYAAGIDGDLRSGTFRVFGLSANVNQSVMNNLNYWEFEEGECKSHSSATVNFSHCSVTPAGPGHFLIHDRGTVADHYSKDPTQIPYYDAPYPTIYALSSPGNGEAPIAPVASLHSSLVSDKYSSGAEIFTVGNSKLMVYGDSGADPHYSIASVPSAPESLDDAILVARLSQGKPMTHSSQVVPVTNRPTFCNNVVHVESINDNEAHVYAMTNNHSMAKYVVTAEGTITNAQNVAVIESAAPCRIYDLSGRVIFNLTTAPTGLYIALYPDGTAKRIFRK